MLWELLISIMSAFSIVLTFMSFVICLPRKFPLPAIIAIFTVYTTMLLVINFFTDYIALLPIPPGWAYIPLVSILFKGHVLQKIFLLFSQLFISLGIILFFSMLYGFFLPYGSNQIFILMLITVILVFTAYIILTLKFGKQLLKKFFEGGSKAQWTLYMISTLVAHTSIFVLWRVHQQNNIVHIFALIFIVWSFVILCYAIINTHEKAKRKYEADFARDIIATGRGYYQKMNEQFDALRIMKHDYKFHLNAAIDMLRRGEVEKSDEYLSSLQNQLLEKEMPNYCDNPVINSLISDFAGRCRRSNIDLNVSISSMDDFSIPNYEMCIVLGNLLENAVEACQKLESKNGSRQIKLIIKSTGELSTSPQGEVSRVLSTSPQGEVSRVLSTCPQGEVSGAQLAIKISNTFDGNVVMDGEKYISTKKDADSGIGLESIAAVIQHYGEMFHIEHDSEWFNVFVLWK